MFRLFVVSHDHNVALNTSELPTKDTFDSMIGKKAGTSLRILFTMLVLRAFNMTSLISNLWYCIYGQ